VFLTGEGALNPDIIDFSALSIMSSASELPRNTPSTVPTILGHDTNMLLRKYSRKIQGRKPGRRSRCRQDYVFKVPSGLVGLIRV